jgi:RNA polymerase sigma-70 factor (ECF subfamily)
MTDGPRGRATDDDDFETWFRSEYPRVLGALVLALGSREAAEEVTAEAFARAYERWDRVRGLARPGGWVYTVALNEARRKWRRRALEWRLLSKSRAESPVAPETGVELWDLVRTLPPRQRTAVVLRYVGDLSEAEVAKAMGISTGAVAKTLHVARSRLGSRLEATYDRGRDAP